MAKQKVIESDGLFVELVEREHYKEKGLLFDIKSEGRFFFGNLIPLEHGDYPISIEGKKTEECRILEEDEIPAMTNAKLSNKFFARMPTSGCSIGTDPEIFVVDAKNQVIPAFTFLPKKNERTKHFWDGFQAEFLTSTSSRGNEGCLAYLADEVQAGLKAILVAARKECKSARLIWDSVIEIPIEVMKSAKEEHILLGCAPSKNVYGITPIKVGDPRLLSIRFAGCHFHFGVFSTMNKREQVIEKMIKMMDAIFGVISISLFQGMEDHRRRRYYGRAGEYRLPPWGLEYRTPSSAVLSHPALFHLSFELCRMSYYLATLPMAEKYLWKFDPEEVKDVINTYDVELAKKLLMKNENMLQTLLKRRFNKYAGIIRTIMDGALSYFDLSSIEKNWHLTDDRWEDHSEAEACHVTNTVFGGERNQDY